MPEVIKITLKDFQNMRKEYLKQEKKMDEERDEKKNKATSNKLKKLLGNKKK